MILCGPYTSCPSPALTHTGTALDPDTDTQYLWQRFADGSMTVASRPVGARTWGPPMELRVEEVRG